MSNDLHKTTASPIWPWNAAAAICFTLAMTGVVAGLNSRYPAIGWFFLVQAVLGAVGAFSACVAAERENANGKR